MPPPSWGTDSGGAGRPTPKAPAVADAVGDDDGEADEAEADGLAWTEADGAADGLAAADGDGVTAGAGVAIGA